MIAYHKGFNKFYQSDDGLAWSSVKRLGVRQQNLLAFACKYPGLHSYAKDSARRVASLAARGLLTHLQASGQFQAVSGRVM